MELKHLKGLEREVDRQIAQNKRTGHSKAFKREAAKWGVRRPGLHPVSWAKNIMMGYSDGQWEKIFGKKK